MSDFQQTNPHAGRPADLGDELSTRRTACKVNKHFTINFGAALGADVL